MPIAETPLVRFVVDLLHNKSTTNWTNGVQAYGTSLLVQHEDQCFASRGISVAM